jgi:hypothetical protein
LVDEEILPDRNLAQEKAENKLKCWYEKFSTEIQRLWNVKFFVIPAVSGATTVVTKKA